LAVLLLSQKKFRNRISKIKLGDFEVQLDTLREEIQKGTDKIAELESEVENDRRLFEDILNSFDPDAPVSDLRATMG